MLTFLMLTAVNICLKITNFGMSAHFYALDLKIRNKLLINWQYLKAVSTPLKLNCMNFQSLVWLSHGTIESTKLPIGFFILNLILPDHWPCDSKSNMLPHLILGLKMFKLESIEHIRILKF